MVLEYNPERIRFLSLRIAPGSAARSLKGLRDKWKTLDPQRPFDYFFLDSAFDSLYRNEERIGNLSLQFTLLAVFIGGLGLFGLAAYMAERRTREIGIRKVLGASAAGIIGLLSKEFLWLVVIANGIAWPTAYWLLNVWLRNYPYRIGIGLPILLVSGLLALLTALFSVIFQAVKAAYAEPADALRYD